ncbi:Translation initiation factor IF-2, chloroplastic [Apostasia shenzhenica]|uniref:Eukaryotic translation initiation factor 5B n=2 Tax=Magnoliopsida TaxID=3398 RepID=A0A2I0A4C3_9ASPA|nr:Translation initiation factor IF-2, chloroplastic [Apostasia shenzhenica]
MESSVARVHVAGEAAGMPEGLLRGGPATRKLEEPAMSVGVGEGRGDQLAGSAEESSDENQRAAAAVHRVYLPFLSPFQALCETYLRSKEEEINSILGLLLSTSAAFHLPPIRVGFDPVAGLDLGPMGRKKTVAIDDDEYSFPTDEQPEQQSHGPEKENRVLSTAASKKNKKAAGGGGKAQRQAERVDEAVEIEKPARVEEMDDFRGPSGFSGKNKQSKNKKSNAVSSFSALSAFEDDDGDLNDEKPKEDEEEDEDAAPIAFTGKKKKSSKSNKKTSTMITFGALNALGDEEEEDHNVKAEPEENEAEPPISFSGKKKPSKSKKGNSLGGFSVIMALEEEEDYEVESTSKVGNVEAEEPPPDLFPGKKTYIPRKDNVSPASGAFDILDKDEGYQKYGEEEEPILAAFSGKKKPSKSKKDKSSSAFDDLVQEKEIYEDENKDEYSVVVFSGKKKPSKSKIDKASSAFDVFDEGENGYEPEQKPKSGAETNSRVEDDSKSSRLDEYDDSSMGRQQKKKKKKGGRSAQEEEDLDKILEELGEGPPPPSSTSTETVFQVINLKEADVDTSRQDGFLEDASSKNKKKKKKSGRTVQEEEDLDMILSELGEGPTPAPSSSVPPSMAVEKLAPVPFTQDNSAVDAATEEKDGEPEGMESAAAKKKKKKKEKEKEKKAAAAAAAAIPIVVEAQDEKKDGAKGKVADKKLPKHVREMQEALARRKEAEERKKREEEERLRKEEEERKRLEELERLAEEAKKRKKEREKEKLLKKKQEGKLLTAKQREEQKRLEAMRRQFLGQNENPTADSAGETKKKPVYQTKKPKSAQAKSVDIEKAAETQNEAVEVDAEDQPVEEIISQVAEVHDKFESITDDGQAEVIEEEEDEEEWDAKSWDDVDVKLPGSSPFSEEDKEEVDAEPVIRKVGGVPLPTPVDTPSKKEEVENKHKTLPVTDPQRNEVSPNHELQNSEDKAKKSGVDLRSPICCILGHVDTGKTKLLDCIRRTNVQEGEAGGITQQIGATYFPTENIRERTKELKADATLKVPGLLVIDTPGHESFTNLRSRGSSLCDIAVLVVDIMHGLEPQTIESLNLLKSRNTEFIVALNKVDRLYGWKKCLNAPIRKAMNQQSNDVKNEFNMRLTQIITQFKEQGLNTALYYKNKDLGETFNIVPTSALSGEGIPDLLLLLVQWAQKTMEDKLTYVDEVQCTVLEVKVIEGLGTTIDVVLVNGILHEGDQIVVCGMQGPIVTNIRALLTPHPMKELRVKAFRNGHLMMSRRNYLPKLTFDDVLRVDSPFENLRSHGNSLPFWDCIAILVAQHFLEMLMGSYLHHKELKAAQGVKISAQGLEHAIAGTALYVVKPGADIEAIKESVMHDMNKVMNRIDKSGEGVYVQASTLVLGVEVIEGIAKIGTPICIPSREFIDIGRIASIEINHRQVEVATKGQKVAIKIVSSNAEEQQKMFGRHFDAEDELVSHITRRSIDLLKANYRLTCIGGNSVIFNGVNEPMVGSWIPMDAGQQQFKIVVVG